MVMNKLSYTYNDDDDEIYQQQVQQIFWDEELYQQQVQQTFWDSYMTENIPSSLDRDISVWFELTVPLNFLPAAKA